MAGSSGEYKPPELAKLKKSADYSFYVEDKEYGMYEIDSFLGDDTPNIHVFRAMYSSGSRFINFDQGGKRRRDDNPQVVTLKLARIDNGSDEFKNLKNQVENSLRIGPSEDQENDVVTANCIVVRIYKYFEYKNFFCVSMPYMEGGSLRYIIDKRVYDWLLPEKYIAVVLREVLDGLRFLHRLGKVHKKLNAGNIFVLGNFNEPQGRVTVKLGYRGSTYFHYPEDDPEIFGPPSPCPASNLEINRFWTIQGIYEPSSREEENYTEKSDIWNLGVTALELAFGPIRENISTVDELRTTNEFRTFLGKLRKNKQMKLPKLLDLFFPEPGSRTAKKSSIASRSIAAAKKVRKGFNIAGKKLKSKLLPQKSKPNLQALLNQKVQLSNLFTAMVKKCLAFDPSKRPTAEQILADPFFQKHQNVGLQDLRNFIRNLQY